MLLTVGTAWADASMRCGRDLIQQGDSALEVIEACGEPSRELSPYDAYRADINNRWLYEGEHGKADRMVIFREGRVERIERLD